MRTIVYQTADDDVPERARFLAHFLSGKELLPLQFTGPNEETVRGKAAEWLAAETAREAVRIEARRKAREARAAAASRKAAEKAGEER